VIQTGQLNIFTEWPAKDLKKSNPDLEKAASGASGACGHFVKNHAILRTF